MDKMRDNYNEIHHIKTATTYSKNERKTNYMNMSANDIRTANNDK